MSPAGFLVPRVGGDGLNRVGDKAALDHMGSERDVRPLCPRPAFWCHELVAVGFVALGTKLRSMTWVVNETSGRYVPGRLFGATSWGGGLCRVGDKAALCDMGSERVVRPLCPRSALERRRGAECGRENKHTERFIIGVPAR